MKRKKELLRCLALLALSLTAGLGLSLYPETASQGAAAGLDVCLSVLVPSLFPFLVLSVFLVRSGASSLLGRILEKPTRLLFRLPGCCAPVILMGMIGGYPVGARGTASLLRTGDVTEEEAGRLTLFCVNAGPAFVLSAVGARFLHSARAGGILLASSLTASLLLGLLLRGRGPVRLPRRTASQTARTGAGEALVASVSDACRSLVVMCCFVVLFSVVLAFLSLLLPPGMLVSCLSAVLEVTGGCRDLSAAGAPPWTLAAALGWGGLCVQLQILSLPGTPRLPLWKFSLARLAHAALAALVSLPLCTLLPPDVAAQPVFSNTTSQASPALAASPAAAAALLLSCAVFFAAGGRWNEGRRPLTR